MDSVSNSSPPDQSISSDNNLPAPRLDPIQPAQPLNPLLPPAANPLQPVSVQPVAPNTPDIADDADLIEKEWVVKAKHIVEQTKNDPHLLNQEMNKIKADYIKKRYNKDIRTTSD